MKSFWWDQSAYKPLCLKAKFRKPASVIAAPFLRYQPGLFSSSDNPSLTPWPSPCQSSILPVASSFYTLYFSMDGTSINKYIASWVRFSSKTAVKSSAVLYKGEQVSVVEQPLR